MRKLIAVALLSCAALPALADEKVEVDPERRALLISIIEDLGCRVNGATPPKEFLDAMGEHKFVKEETKAIAAQLFEEGVAERSGAELVLKTEKCG